MEPRKVMVGNQPIYIHAQENGWLITGYEDIAWYYPASDLHRHVRSSNDEKQDEMLVRLAIKEVAEVYLGIKRENQARLEAKQSHERKLEKWNL